MMGKASQMCRESLSRLHLGQESQVKSGKTKRSARCNGMPMLRHDAPAASDAGIAHMYYHILKEKEK